MLALLRLGVPCASAGEEGRASLRPGCFHWRCPPLHRGPCTTRSIPTPPRPAPTPSTHKVNYHQHLFSKSYNLSSFQQFPIFFSTRNILASTASGYPLQQMPAMAVESWRSNNLGGGKLRKWHAVMFTSRKRC